MNAANGYYKTVSVNESTASINQLGATDYFYGGFGGVAAYSWNDNTKDFDVRMSICGSYPGGTPRTGQSSDCIYYSTYEADGQHLALPMVGRKSTKASKVTFFHVTAAVNMLVWNNTDRPLYVDTLTVECTDQDLFYDIKTTTLTDNVCEFTKYGNTSGKKVSVVFTTPAEIPAGEQVTLQVPIMPLPAGSYNLTLGIKAHHNIPGKANGGRLRHTFSHTGAAPATGLARNQVLLAKINFAPKTNSKITTTGGLFSVSPTKQVVFSRGNLLWYYGNQYFTFWEEQYQCLGYNGVNNIMDINNCANASDKRQDLFHYGSSGVPTYIGNHSYAYDPGSRTSGLTSYCYPNDLTGTTADWGNGLPINSTGAAGGESFGTDWRTLTKSEWEHLLGRNLHERVTLGEGFTFEVSATMYWALILYPDNWQGGMHGNTEMTLEQWRAYEAKGAVLLPAAGRRIVPDGVARTNYVEGTTVTGYYWTANKYAPVDIKKAHYLVFSYGTTPTVAYDYGELGRGLAVRLVQDF